MTTFIPRFALRLLLPVLALGAIAALGEPLPASAATESTMSVPAAETAGSFSVAIEQEAEELRREAIAARKAAHHTASQMRWFITFPAASSKRCASASCAS